ncbi:MAG: methylated-DNA--[protein]-cysteine S-methyltransferase [Clostridia bacterium]|nr:methylated-DNA--[protein]-cysteine S-methyltransferase [Clostridia bacterium]
MRYLHYWQSPLGQLGVVASEQAVYQINFACEVARGPVILGQVALHKEVEKQLNEYFAGRRCDFALPLRAEGTEFQRAVWQALQELSYGQTVSYGELAAQIGRPKACRAVGGALHTNPLAIVIPCHRVVGKDGSLTGFGGGLQVKRFLLDLERRYQGNFVL